MTKPRIIQVSKDVQSRRGSQARAINCTLPVTRRGPKGLEMERKAQELNES